MKRHPLTLKKSPALAKTRDRRTGTGTSAGSSSVSVSAENAMAFWKWWPQLQVSPSEVIKHDRDADMGAPIHELY